MKQELDRVKNDVETIQKAIGLAPSMGREWIRWLKRDNWLNLWWCLPGFILIASSFLPPSNTEKYLGFGLAQWTGLLVCVVILGILIVSIRKTTANDGRPESLIREYKRFWGVDAHGAWVGLALILEFSLYFAWAKHFRISMGAFCSGLFIFGGGHVSNVGSDFQNMATFGVGNSALGLRSFCNTATGQGNMGDSARNNVHHGCIILFHHPSLANPENRKPT